MVERLLRNLIEIPSISGKEKKIANFVFDYLKNNGLRPKFLFGNNVYCEIGKGEKALLLNSHLDTVPPSNFWTRKPFKAKTINGRIYGLGACDTKGSLAAMIETMIDLNNLKEELKGKVIFTATDKEEGFGLGPSGMERLAKKLKFDAVVIGEPTNLDICTGEKGLLGLKIISKGKAGHAASSSGINAIFKAAEDINRLKNLKLNRRHKLLGLPSIQVTMINGGIKPNIIPDRCEFIVDIRTTPIYPNNLLLSLIKKQIKSEIEIRTNRIFPKEVNIKEKIVEAAKKTAPQSKVTGFWAVSDFAFIDKPGIILGPGNSKQAHGGDEFVEISQVKKVKEIYKKIIQNYFLHA
jgi:acetylornithine deacetylase